MDRFYELLRLLKGTFTLVLHFRYLLHLSFHFRYLPETSALGGFLTPGLPVINFFFFLFAWLLNDRGALIEKSSLHRLMA